MNRQNRALSNWTGYCFDLFSLARGVPINLHSYMKFVSISNLKRRTGARTLIETGTYLGVTSARCARVYEKVLTIEIDQKLAREAASYLARFSNVEVFQADAVEILPDLISRNDVDDVVVFLDGHFSGSDTGLGAEPEPVLSELKILAGYPAKIRGIIIDDFRCFGLDEGFPKKSEVVRTLEELFPYPRFEIRAHADQLIVERTLRC